MVGSCMCKNYHFDIWCLAPDVNKTGVFAIQLYFFYFFIVKNDHVIFFNGRIRLLNRAHLLRIDSGTG